MDRMQEEAVPNELKSNTTATPAEQDKSHEVSQSPRVQAALEAQRKRRGLTHAPRMSVTEGVLKAISRPGYAAAPGPAKRINENATPSEVPTMPSTRKSANRTTRFQDTGSKPDSTPAKPSLIVKLRIRSLLSSAPMKQEKSIRRSKRVKVKSEEFVTSDIEDDDVDTANNDADTPITEAKRATRSSTRTRTPSAKSLASSTPSTSRSHTNTSCGTASPSATTSSYTSTTPHKPQCADKKSPTSSAAKVPTSTPSSSHQLNKQTLNPSLSTKSIPSTPSPYIFPPFPKLPIPRRSPFHLGASIALSNILEDHALYPQESLLQLLQGLEDDLPIFERDDWEHRTVLKGGMWVCGVVREAGGLGAKADDEEEAEEEAGKKGKRKRVEDVDVDVDVVEMVKRLEDWVDKEWVRVRPVEKVVLSEESEDDCGCGSRHCTPEVEDFETRKRKS